MNKPSALVLTLLLLLAGACAYLLRPSSPDPVPRAQEQMVTAVAQGVADTVDDVVSELRVEAALPVIDTNWLRSRALGVALVDSGTRAVISAHGDPLPLDKLPTTTDVSVTLLPGNDLRLLVAAPAPNGQLLVAAVVREMPFAPVDGKADQTVVLLDRDGKIIGKRGASPSADAQAALRAGSTGALDVARVPVASEVLPGLVVASAVKEPQPAGLLTRWPGLVPAGALVLVAVAGLALARGPRGRVIVAAGAVCWSAVVAATTGVGAINVPEAVVSASNGQLGTTADAVRHVFSSGGVNTDGSDIGAFQPAVQRLAERPEYRTASVIDRSSGSVVFAAGEPSLRSPGVPPVEFGVAVQENPPLLYQHSTTAGRYTLVAEYDMDHLVSVLRRAPGDVRLVDKDLRTIATSRGPGTLESMVTAAKDVFAGKAGARMHENRSVVAYRQVEVSAPIEKLALVSEQSAAEVNPAGAAQQRNGRLVAGGGAVVALLIGFAARMR